MACWACLEQHFATIRAQSTDVIDARLPDLDRNSTGSHLGTYLYSCTVLISAHNDYYDDYFNDDTLVTLIIVLRVYSFFIIIVIFIFFYDFAMRGLYSKLGINSRSNKKHISGYHVQGRRSFVVTRPMCKARNFSKNE